MPRKDNRRLFVFTGIAAVIIISILIIVIIVQSTKCFGSKEGMSQN